MTSWKFLIFIIWFSRGKTNQVSGGLFMLSSVVEFNQILPFRFHPLWNFLLISIEICQEINICNLCCNALILKKPKITLSGPYLGKNWASISHTLYQVHFFFQKLTKGDCELSKTLFYQNIISWVIFCLVCMILYFEAKASPFSSETEVNRYKQFSYGIQLVLGPVHFSLLVDFANSYIY